MITLLFERFGPSELKKGESDHNDSDYQGNGRRHIVVVCLKGKLIHPGNQNIRPAGRLPANRGAAAIEQINDIKIVKVGRILNYEQRRGGKQHMRQRNIAEFLPARPAVHIGRFIGIMGDALQYAGEQSEHKRKAQPYLNADQRDLRKQRIDQPRDRRQLEPIPQHAVNRPEPIVEQCGKNHDRHKVRNCPRCFSSPYEMDL